ncbi:hypothetical protein BJV74DRAFT_773819, partial [Russula compacta]
RARLYVGNLSPRITEDMLTGLFAVGGPVHQVKIISDNETSGVNNCGFVEYTNMSAAETALQDLNGRQILGTEISIYRLYQNQQNNEDTSGHFHVLVCDLSPEVNDGTLARAFSAFGTSSVARVMRDTNSGKSCGYGFLAFRDKTDAEQAIATMNGKRLGSRNIRVIWANQTTQVGPSSSSASSAIGDGRTAPAPTNYLGSSGRTAPAPTNYLSSQLGQPSYETVVRQTPPHNTTVYIENLDSHCSIADLRPLFESIGDFSDMAIYIDDFGFKSAHVKMDTHAHAAMAIVQLQGQMVHGRPIQSRWWRYSDG